MPSGTSFTVEAWLNTTTTSKQVAFSTMGGTVFWFGVDTNGQFCAAYSATIGDSGVTINDGAWHHCVMVVDSGTTVRMFVDGAVAGTFVTGGFTGLPETDARIGNHPNFASYSWSGVIDELAVFSGVKYTSSFTPASSAYTGSETNLVALYHLDSDVTDSQGSGGGGGGLTSTTTSLTASPSSTVSGATVSLTATVTSSSATGTVTFYDGGSSIGTGTLSGGTASMTTTTLSIGSHSLTAVYGGDSTYATSTSSAATEVVSSSSNTIIDPTNAAIIYSPFNWSVSTGYARTVNAGAYFRTIFSGTSVALATDTTPNSTPFTQLWVRVDNDAWQLVRMSAGSPTISIATGLANRKHMLEVVVKSTTAALNRWVSPQTIVQITGIVLDSGASLTAPVRRSKNVLIYGDSITEAQHSVSSTNSDDVLNNDALGGYAYALTTGLDAEVGIVAFGGTGIINTGAGGVPNLPGSYNYLYSGVARSFSSPAPDLVIYNEGQNDSTSDISSAYAGVVNAVLAAAPSSKHILLLPFYNGVQVAHVTAAVAAVNSPQVTLGNTTGWWDVNDSPDGLHPYNYSHVYLIAPKLIAAIMPILYPSTSASGGRSYSFS